MTFEIINEKFQGPIHLLLSLIEERKMHISEVSIATVTQDFLGFIEQNGGSLDDRSQFIVVASTLLLIKARSLVPGLQITDEETKSIESLVNRVELLQLMRERSKELQNMFGRSIILPGVPRNTDVSVFAPDATLSRQSLYDAVQSIIALIPKPEVLREVAVAQVLKIEDIMESLFQRISSGISYSFGAVMDKFKASAPEHKKQAKHEVIVTFLALLELARKGITSLIQNEHFSDIEAQQAPKSAP